MTKKVQATPEISVLNGTDTLIEYLKKHKRKGDVTVKVDQLLDEEALCIALHHYDLTSVSGNYETLIYTFHFVC